MLIFSKLASAYRRDLWATTCTRRFTRGTSFIYNVLYVVLIYFFCYFWTAITFNPKDMADNLKNFGTFIPGYRPGQAHGRLPGKSDGPDHVRRRRLFGGRGDRSDDHFQLELGIPFIVSPASTAAPSLLIAVSVAFDLVQKIDSHLVMRNYTGLLEK